MSDDDEAGTATATRVEWIGAQATSGIDTLAREEPLELRIAGVSIAVVMRTPGHDLELARGFALTERIVAHPREIIAVRHCDRVEVPDAEDNVVQLVLADDVHVDLVKLRRHSFASSSCGVCGKASIEQAMACAPALAGDATVSIATMRSLPDRLRAGQQIFDRTGGLHGAALCDTSGTPLVVREDVGRHNAVDKVIGWAALHRAWPLHDLVLAISGRTSFEIVQKSLAAGIATIVAVSAPTSLAVELAGRSGITLIGFVRGDRACVYSNAQRVRP
ncbi:MAG TPA: formate dehydrogenase accessory sulfurtransferase FdhD [Nannocystaceae bacterium]|nr:formate dehydrogenase accessory sulfurtransferase FdhD [Nannocystaceae bacterium]